MSDVRGHHNAASLRINLERLLGQLDQLNAINRQEDRSCCRLALTDADRGGRDLVVSWMKAAGLEVQVDRIGNIIGLQLSLIPPSRKPRPLPSRIPSGRNARCSWPCSNQAHR